VAGLKKSDNKTVLKAFGMVSQVGITMLAPIFLSVYIGMKLDDWFDTGYLFIVFLLLGVLAAFRNVYLLMRKFYAKDLKREEEELRYFAELKNAKEEKTGENNERR
jgi:F0F1-type ATP synthase assembly protein I